MKHNLPIKERIEQHILCRNECWLTDLTHVSGYPKISINGKMKTASRVMYKIYYGNIPEGYLVCHSCDNPACINPDHLFMGTHQDNANDRKAKGRIFRVLSIKKTE